MGQELSRELLTFIEKSPTAFHAVAEVRDLLLKNGFQELKETEKWTIEKGKSYFTERNQSSLIAFSIPEEYKGFRIIASHSDSPTFKVKENPEMKVEQKYVKLNVEPYGGMIQSTWFDRPLSVAGRLMVRENGAICPKLVKVDRDLLMIPNLAIHMNREVNKGYAYNAQKDLLPLFGDMESEHQFMRVVAEEAGVREEDILGYDLFLYNRMKGIIWGNHQEYVSSPRLDDLQCAYASLRGFLDAEKKENIAVYCLLDNEEVGSETQQGAASTFLYDTLKRVNNGLGGNEEDYLIAVANSFLLSADNAHAVHPNHTDKADPVNRPCINGGIVIKFHAGQKYCTDGVSAAMLKDVCEKAEVPYQTFTNRSDMAGGSTLGNISNTHVSLRAADLGLAQLAMHSCYETAGTKDTEYLTRVSKTFYC